MIWKLSFKIKAKIEFTHNISEVNVLIQEEGGIEIIVVFPGQSKRNPKKMK